MAYRWFKTWCVLTEPGECSPGDSIEIESSKGVQIALVEHVLPYRTKSGKDKERVFVKDESS